MGWQLDVFLNSCSPMSQYYYSEHQQTEISTVVHNTIWKKKITPTHRGLSCSRFLLQAQLCFHKRSCLHEFYSFITEIITAWKIPLNFYHRCTQMHHIPTRKDMVFIADSHFTVSTTPVNTGHFFYRELHESELCLINKSITPPPTPK